MSIASSQPSAFIRFSESGLPQPSWAPVALTCKLVLCFFSPSIFLSHTPSLQGPSEAGEPPTCSPLRLCASQSARAIFQKTIFRNSNLRINTAHQMLVFFWGNGAEDHLFKEKGKPANLVRAVVCRLLGFTPPSGKILEDRTPPDPD